MPSGSLTTVFIGVLEVRVMRVGWYLAMAAVTLLALMPIEHLQLPVFDWWDKAQHALAFVVLTGKQDVTEDELKAFVKDKLAPYKYPRQIEFVSDLPKTATGKIQRFRLRDQESKSA